MRATYSTTDMDELGAHVNRLIGMIEESPALSDDQRRMILNRNPKATAQSGPVSLVKLFRISLFSRTMRAYMQDTQKVTTAQSLLGDELFYPNDLYFLKPPGTGQAVAWHQDSWYFRNLYQARENDSIEGVTLGTWLAIDDADEENGCLWVIPGTHRRGVVAHEDDPNAEGIFLGNKLPKITAEMERQAMPVEVPKGSVIFFNNALLHRSTPNRSVRYRRAYIVHYMKATVQHTAHVEHYEPYGSAKSAHSAFYLPLHHRHQAPQVIMPHLYTHQNIFDALIFDGKHAIVPGIVDDLEAL